MKKYDIGQGEAESNITFLCHINCISLHEMYEIYSVKYNTWLYKGCRIHATLLDTDGTTPN